MQKAIRVCGYFLGMVLLVISCNKDVGLVTEVEFDVAKQYTSDGFVNEIIPVGLTIIPEEILEDITYSFQYKIEGSGLLLDATGNELPSEEKIDFNTLDTFFDFSGLEEGNQKVVITVEDSYGFSNEVELLFNISDVPVTWEASSLVTIVELGKTIDILLTLDSETEGTLVSYKGKYNQSSGSGFLIGFPTTNDLFPKQFTEISEGTYPLRVYS